jgi:hypothetical protein
MKKRLHVFGIVGGLACTMAFAMLPFVSHATNAPGLDRGPVVKKDSGPTKSGMAKKHVKRDHVPRHDDGCAE